MNIENDPSSESHQTCLDGRVVRGESIANTQECFVQLWLRLERTRHLLKGQYKRFCIRRVLKMWFGAEASDDFIWEVCFKCDQLGWDELPPPRLYPRKHRELLRAIVAVKLGISYYRVNLQALDSAYSIAFPHSTPLNVRKQRKGPNGSSGGGLCSGGRSSCGG